MTSSRGMTLIDVIVGTALILVIFISLFDLLRVSVYVAAVSKAKAAAVAIANSQMEYVRALAYDAVGTVGGIPAGVMPQTTTTTEAGIQYTVRTLVEYVDDSFDGTGSSDTNSVATDYKRVKIEITYSILNATRSLSILSTVAPLGVETTTHGGTLKLFAVNAVGTGVSGATVRVQNASTTPTVDVTTFTNADGLIMLPGAATSSGYRITVSKTGYSSAQTYDRTVTNVNPTPGHLTISENQTTTGTFAIDLLSPFTLRTFVPGSTNSFSDTFTDSTSLSTMTNTAVTGGALVLSGASGSYPASGSAISTTTMPSSISSWGQVSATLSKPTGTGAVVRVVDSSGALIPDSALPGNATGFGTFPVSLSGVSTSTYPSLALSTDFTTSDNTKTPSVLDWSLSYTGGPTPLPNVSYQLVGAKKTGSTSTGGALYKTTIAASTNASGYQTHSLEYDLYTLSVSGYDVIDACPAAPYSVQPNTSYDDSLTLGSLTTNSALVSVYTNTGAMVSGASVGLAKSGFAATTTSSSCGSAYFGGISSGTYTVTVAKTGYTTLSHPGVVVSGHIFYAASF